MRIHAKKLAGAYRQFADMTLARCGAELKVAFGRTLSDEEYLQQVPWLEQRLIAFYVLSGAYRPTEVVAHLMHWKALHQSIVQQGPEVGNICIGKRQRRWEFWLKQRQKCVTATGPPLSPVCLQGVF